MIIERDETRRRQYIHVRTALERLKQPFRTENIAETRYQSNIRRRSIDCRKSRRCEPFDPELAFLVGRDLGDERFDINLSLALV